MVIPSREKPRFRAMETALRKISGMMTALPRLSQTPPSRLATNVHSVRKSSIVARPRFAPSMSEVMCTMSVPIATWTVTGI